MATAPSAPDSPRGKVSHAGPGSQQSYGVPTNVPKDLKAGGDQGAVGAIFNMASMLFGGAASESQTELTGTSRCRSVAELLDTLHSSASRGDIRAYFGCFHANARFLGTVTDENWSMGEYLQFCYPYFDKPGGGWTYIPIKGARRLNYYPDERTGDVCNFDEQLKTPDSPDICRGTGTAVYSTFSGSWFIYSYHLSIDTSQELERTIQRYEEEKLKRDAERRAEREAALKVSKLVMNGVGTLLCL
jgi:hypothetical protein